MDLLIVEIFKTHIAHMAARGRVSPELLGIEGLLCLDEVENLGKGFQKLLKVLFVEENLVFVVNKLPIIKKPLFAFCNCEVIIPATGGLYIKKIGSFSGFYSSCEDLILLVLG